MIGRDVFLLDALREAPDDEVLPSFLAAVLRAGDSVPRRDLRCPIRDPDAAELEAFLGDARGGAQVRLTTPQRGEKRS